MNMLACSCLPDDTLQRLATDSHAPSLVACAGCCRLEVSLAAVTDESSRQGRVFPTLQESPPFPLASPGMTFGDAVRANGDRRLTFNPLPDAPSIRPLLLDGQSLGEIFVLRATADGQAMLFPGNSTPWYERIIHPDDLAVGFGMVLPEQPTRNRHVWAILGQGLQTGGLRFTPQLLYRLR